MNSAVSIILAVSAGILLAPPSFAAENATEATVKQFITVVKTKDPKKIAQTISYPLNREVPVPAINTPKEFIKRFDEIFDSKLLETITGSDAGKDWSEMGWRGIMLGDGLLWLDENGKVIAINYQSAKEKHLRASLIRQDKSKLYSGLRRFQSPVLEWKTAKFHIRIDQVDDANFRYAAWPVGKSTREKPDLILEHGNLVFDGNGGNHYYDFNSGDYLYRCYVNVIGTDTTPPGELEVSKNKKVILEQAVVEVIN